MSLLDTQQATFYAHLLSDQEPRQAIWQLIYDFKIKKANLGKHVPGKQHVIVACTKMEEQGGIQVFSISVECLRLVFTCKGKAKPINNTCQWFCVELY